MPWGLVRLALVASGLLASGSVFAATCTVPTTHASVLAAVNDSGCNPIEIAAGEFPAAIVITRSLSLVGNGSTATRLLGANGVPTLTLGNSATISITGVELATTSASNFALRVDGANVSLADVRVGIAGAPAAPVSTVTNNNDAESLAARFDRAGRFIVFQSRASNLTGSSANGSFDIYRIDRNCAPSAMGCQRVQRVSLDDASAPINGDATLPSVSADGNLVVFVAPDAAVAKVRGETAKQAQQRAKGASLGVFLRNMQTGRTDRVGTASGTGTGAASPPQVAPGGRAIAFTGIKPGSTSGETAVFRVPLVDSGSGPKPVTADTRCVSCKAVAADGSDTTTDTIGSASAPTISADGQWVAFETTAKNALAGQTPTCPNTVSDILLRNMLTGVQRNVSAPTSSSQCGATGSGASAPQMDYAGTRMVFQSNQPLTTRTTAPQIDVYVADLRGGNGFTRVSQGSDGSDANSSSRQPTISGDGRSVAYVSTATNLVPADTDSNSQDDLFVRSLIDSTQQRVNKAVNGDQANGTTNRPTLDYSGRTLAFDSMATNLSSGATPGVTNVFEAGNPLTKDAVFYTGFE